MILKIGKHIFENAVLLAPMEGITDLPFRLICKQLGADIVYSEFIASEALVRDIEKSKRKMRFNEQERPIAVQIFGSRRETMVESAKIIEESGVDILDINFGCWVKKVVNNNAGAAFLKNPESMAEMSRAVSDAVSIPVTIKTRLGWDKNSIVILEAAKMLEQSGIAALTIHCRTRDMAMRGAADWSWVAKVKKSVNIPIILNGDVRTPLDARRAFDSTNCDAVMIGRAAIGNPFIFKHIKHYLNTGELLPDANIKDRFDTCLLHLKLSIENNGIPRGIYEFRKHYAGYLKSLHNGSKLRQELVLMETYKEIENALNNFICQV